MRVADLGRPGYSSFDFERSLADRIALLPGWRGLFEFHWVVVVLVCWAVTPSMLWLNDVLIVHGRFLSFDQQRATPLVEVLLPLATLLLAGSLREAPRQAFPPWLRQRRLHVLLVALMYGLAAANTWREWDSLSAVGPNWLWHTLVVYPLVGYPLLLMIVASVVVIFSARTWYKKLHITGLVAALFCLFTWGAAIEFDARHQYAPGGIHKSQFANPPDPWCGGLLTKPFCGPPQR